MYVQYAISLVVTCRFVFVDVRAAYRGPVVFSKDEVGGWVMADPRNNDSNVTIPRRGLLNSSNGGSFF